MSKTNHNRICRRCGETNAADARVCTSCGEPLVPDARAKVPLSPVVANAASADAPGWYRALHRPAVYNGIISLICAALLLLLFAPFISVSSRTPAGGSYSASFSPAEILEYAISSASSHDEISITKTSEYKEYRRLASRASGALSQSALSSSRAELLGDYSKSYIEVGLMRLGYGPSVYLVLSALLTAAYAFIAFIAFIASFAGFISALRARSKKAGRGVRASRSIVLIAASSPIYLLLMAEACRFSFDVAPLGFGVGGTGAAWGLIVSAALLSLVPIYALVRCYASLTGFVGFKASAKSKLRLVAVLLLLLSVLAVFMPAISVGFAVGYGKSAKEASLSVGIEDMYYLSYNDRLYYTSLYSASSEANLVSTAEAVTRAKAKTDGIGAQVLHGVLNTYTDLTVLYVGAAVLAVFFMIFAIALIRKLLGGLMNGTRPEGEKKCIAWMIVGASLYFAMCVAISVTANAFLFGATSRYILFGVGIGPTLALGLSIAASAILNLRCADRIEGGFDNPDTSSAPYVI